MSGESGPHALMRTHVETLFTLDAQGRLRSVNETGGTAAPRFFLGQTLEGNQCWFRHDLDGELVRALEALCLQEPIAHDIAAQSLRAGPFEALLAKHGAIENASTR